MSFVNELFERLRKSTTASDVREALASLSNIQDSVERAKAARETANLINVFAKELMERGQYKNAAYQFYSGFQVIHKFNPDPEVEKQWLKSSANALAHASQEHISWDDIVGGAACMAISSLLKIQTGDWNVNEHLDTFIKSHDFSAHQAATACLYIPYDLATAVKSEKPDPTLMQRASNYTETYLLNTKPAAMFIDGIKAALELARAKLMDSVKFPNIRAAYTFDHDIIFGEQFNFNVKLENHGEGIAINATATIAIPSTVQILSGSSSISIDFLNANSSETVEFKLMCPSGEGKEELLVKIPITIVYEDILNNKNSLSLGSANIPVRSEKQAEKLYTQLNEVRNILNKKIQALEAFSAPEILSVTSSFTQMLTKMTQNSEKSIDDGKFLVSKDLIEQLEQMHSFIDPFAAFLQSYDSSSQKRLETALNLNESTKKLLETMKKVHEQLN